MTGILFSFSKHCPLILFTSYFLSNHKLHLRLNSMHSQLRQEVFNYPEKKKNEISNRTSFQGLFQLAFGINPMWQSQSKFTKPNIINSSPILHLWTLKYKRSFRYWLFSLPIAENKFRITWIWMQQDDTWGQLLFKILKLSDTLFCQ